MTLQEKQDKFVDMIKENERLILRVCALYSNAAREELSDLYQDAVCALWESFDSFNNRSKPSTWIYSVTRFNMMNHVRKKRLYATTLDEATMVSSQEHNDDALTEIRDLLSLLPNEDRDLLVMWMEGFSGPEIAQASGLTYGVAAVRLTRIKIRLRKMMKKRCP